MATALEDVYQAALYSSANDMQLALNRIEQETGMASNNQYDTVPLLSQPIEFGTKRQKEEFASKVSADLVKEGRTARFLRRPISTCPRFKDPDMTSWWRSGWYYEDEDRKKIVASLG